MLPTDVMHPRYNTNRLLAAMEEGLVTTETVAKAALDFMSDAEVADMVESWELLPPEDDDEDYECFPEDRCGDPECPECGEEGPEWDMSGTSLDEEEEWDPSPSPASMGLSRDFKKNPLPRFDPDWKDKHK